MHHDYENEITMEPRPAILLQHCKQSQEEEDNNSGESDDIGNGRNWVLKQSKDDEKRVEESSSCAGRQKTFAHDLTASDGSFCSSHAAREEHTSNKTSKTSKIIENDTLSHGREESIGE